MITTVLTVLGYVTTNYKMFVDLGVDVVDLFNKGKALVASDTASTPEERAAVMAEIADLEVQRDAALESLRLRAPGS